MVEGKQVTPHSITATQVDNTTVPTLASNNTFTGDNTFTGGANVSVPSPITGDQAANKSYVDAAITDPTNYNKQISGITTTADGDAATGPADSMVQTPAHGSWVEVLLNGLAISVGDGVKTSPCYFSGDGGTTARSIADIVTGDKLYWVGSVAGYQLDAMDVLDFAYNH